MKQIIWIFIFTVLGISSGYGDNSLPIIAEGIAPVIQDNLVLAKRDARRDAYRRAIEQGVGVKITAETQMEMLQIVSDLVITKAQGYVKSHKVLEEWIDEDSVYHIKIEAVVQEGDIHNDLEALGILIDYVVDNPVVMIVFVEDNPGENQLFSVAEARMSAVFSSAKYHLVDKRQIQLIQEDEITRKMIAGDKDVLITMSDRFNADILIVGEISVAEFKERYTNESGLATVEANANIRAIIARTGQIIISKQSQDKAAALSLESATTKAITKCIDKVAKQFIYEIPTRLFQARTVKIIINNCQFSQRKELLQAFLNISSIINVYPRTFENNTATFDIKTQDSSESLAEALDVLSKPQLNIVTVNAGQVIAEIAPE
ncbi:hypothetical protein GF312_13095 [Candidatus Poribacteria bacterium]|nr:hypothetical protein [Candidatus Poribacteria bacterium]